MTMHTRPTQPGHPHLAKHPSRRTGSMPGQQHEHGRHANVSAPHLVHHKIGSSHMERMSTATQNVVAEGHRNKGTQVGGGEGLRPNLGMQKKVKGKTKMHSMKGVVVP